MSNIIVEIPKEYRGTTKLDLTKNYINISVSLFACYLYVKSNDSLLDTLYIPIGSYRLDVFKIKEVYSGLKELVLLYDIREQLKPSVSYTDNDIFAFSLCEFVKEFK